MSIDLNFWKYQNGICLDHQTVYQKACCDRQEVEGLEALPIEEILQKTAAAFQGWNAPDPCHYESARQGSFQISTTSQTVRFDCYSMELADLKRFSSIMAGFGCPLYDPQQNVRYDKIIAFLIGEAVHYQTEATRGLSGLFPRLEVEIRGVSWEEYVQLSKKPGAVIYNALIHRAKTLTKVTSFMQAGNIWTNRPCQCKTALLTDRDTEHRILAELLQKSIQRTANDIFERTCYK